MPARRGFVYDLANTRLDIEVDGTVAARFNDTGSYLTIPAGGITVTAGGILSAEATGNGIGYTTGAGGAVTQETNRTTAVTLSTLTGAITTDSTSLAAGAEATFTVTNTTVAVGDVVVVCARSGQTAATSIPVVTTVAAGSFAITLTNLHASTADTGAMIINFVVIKAVSA
jgi:hypothetical protein